jgi:hypothetical protein
MSFQLDSDYIDVPTRIAEFREKYPTGSLQQAALEFREVADRWWVVYTAAAYRTPEDMRPGIGTAWEPVPGKTPYTRDSELQNAETAAWGRAIVAALAADTKRGIASAEEVRNRRAEQGPDQVLNAAKAAVAVAWARSNRGGFDKDAASVEFTDWTNGEHLEDAEAERLSGFANYLLENPVPGADAAKKTVQETFEDAEAE